ncbi:MAG: response regulator [Methylococcaceae bacterium]|nr:response regulator [Methylococcaceae bacterium]
MTTKILIVEDEAKLAQLMIDYLSLDGFDCHNINHGDLVIDWVKEQQPQFILLDLMLPGKDGISLCREIRSFSNVPIIMVTARVEEIDRLLGLELGADDYICKPFSPREVVARVKSVLRRSNPAPQTHNNEVVSEAKPPKNIIIDPDKFIATVYGVELELTPIEFRLLDLLSQSPNRVFSREYLMNNVYTDNRIVSDRTMDSHIKNLRKKIKKASEGKIIISTVYGVGYKMSF